MSACRVRVASIPKCELLHRLGLFGELEKGAEFLCEHVSNFDGGGKDRVRLQPVRPLDRPANAKRIQCPCH